MLTKKDIQSKLELVAKGSLPLWDFHAWLQDESWNMHKDSSESTMLLVEDIKLAFEEYYQGRLNELELAERIISIPIVYIRPAPSPVHVSTLPYTRLVKLGESHQKIAYA